MAKPPVSQWFDRLFRKKFNLLDESVGSRISHYTARATVKNKPPKPTLSRRYLPVAIAAVIGVSISLGAFGVVANRASQVAEQKFIVLARNHAHSIVSKIDDGSDQIITLRDYFESADHSVSRSEFGAFSTRLHQHFVGIRDCGWLPHVTNNERAAFEKKVQEEGFPEFEIREQTADGSVVTAKERTDYFPVLYLDVPEHTREVMGFDPSASSSRKAAIERAIATGQTAATAPQTLLAGGKGLIGFQSYAAVYGPGVLPNGTREIKGLIVGVFEIGPMIEGILATMTQPAGLDIYFFKPDGIMDQRLIYWHSSRARSAPAPTPTESSLLAGPHWTQDFKVADQTWSAIFAPVTKPEMGTYSIEAIVTLLFGLTITTMTMAYLYTSIRRTIRLEYLTSNLQRTTENLRDESRKAKHAEEQIRAVTDNLPMLITYSDSERRYRFVNKTGEEWYAKPAEDILGKTVQEVTGHLSTIETPLLFEKLSHGSVRYERTNQHPDGKTRIVDVVNIPDFGSDQKVKGFYSIATDVTERKANEEKFQQIQKLESIGKLTGGVAHDVNNMLAVISGNLELACEDIEQGIDVRKKLQTALRATERGSTLTQSLLSFARQQPLAPQSIDLNEIANDVVDFSRRTLTKNIDVKLVCADDLWHCDADPGQMQNALLNLIVNARDAMPDGGELTVETGNIHFDPIDTALADVEPGDYVMLTVSDTGTGIPPHVLSRVFEPFFTTKNASEGTGLGLSMVYGFVKQSNGHAKIYSEVGHGTSVRIYLPRNAASLQNSPSKTLPNQAHGNGQTILVLEDNPDVRTLVCSLLRSLNYRVLDAGNTDEGLDYVRKRSDIDMLLSDVMLPGAINGPQLAEEARRIRPTLKILFMSGYTENALTHNGRLADGVQLLHKPFSKDSLARKVHEIFDLEAINE